MIKSEFIRIAKKEGGKLSYKDKDIAVGGGVRSPRLVFVLKINHKNHDITIINNTGTSFVANITAHFPVTTTTLDFDLTTKSHLSTLFSKTKERFKVKSNHQNITNFTKNDNGLKQLNTIAQDGLFHPTINGSYTKGSYTLESKYHLQFDDWTQVIEPFIQFYKAFIDEFSQ